MKLGDIFFASLDPVVDHEQRGQIHTLDPRERNARFVECANQVITLEVLKRVRSLFIQLTDNICTTS